MSKIVKIVVDGKNYEYPNETVIENIMLDIYPEGKDSITLCIYNGKLRELSSKIRHDGEIIFEDISTVNGMRTYKRSAILLLQKALDDLFGENPHSLRVMYSISSGYYCKFDDDIEVTNELLLDLENRMKDLVLKDIPLKKSSIKTEDARELFLNKGMKNKERLLIYRSDANINIYDLEGTIDYFYGYMVPSTGYITKFKLYKFDKGFVLQFPKHKEMDRVADFDPPVKLFNVLKSSTQWSKTMNISSVGELNDIIASCKTEEMILMQEALMEAQIGAIAKEVSDRDGVKFIMIAGPSSSGKTTFSHRLSVQLRAKGLTPHPVPLDDFYLDREQIPLDEFGQKDFECIEGIDIERFNNDMQSLLSGKETELPVFDFPSGKRKTVGRNLKLNKEDVLVIEGIHGLNDKLSYTLPVESKFKIYISALSMLAVDEYNPLSTTDGRLLRRIVRDARTRGTSAKETMAMWESVKRGERKNIFPFQEYADAMFNSALIYELAVMKLYAEPQLYAIKPEDEEYAEAKRLLKLLGYVLPMPTEGIPNNSLMREFIGGSCFKV